MKNNIEDLEKLMNYWGWIMPENAKEDIENFITKALSTKKKQIIDIINSTAIPARQGTGTAIQNIIEKIKRL